MNLMDKLLVIFVTSCAATPLGAGTLVGDAAPALSVATALYAPQAAEFRALVTDSRLALVAGMSAAPVCVPPLASAHARAGAPVAAGEPPAGAMQRVLAGPVAAAYAAGAGRDKPSAIDPPSAGPTLPAPAGWKLFLCGFGILAFIAVRRTRDMGG